VNLPPENSSCRVAQGKQAVENIAKSIKKDHQAEYDLLIIGAGPAGISAALTAKKFNLKCITLEQDTLGGTVFTFPRSKIVMTSAMNLPLYGKVKLFETTNVIEFHYGSLEAGNHNSNESASIGVKDGTGGTGNFIEATYNSTTNVVACLKSNLNWPGLNYRFTPPATNQMEQFYKMLVSKSGGNLFIQRDVKITGIE